MNKNCPNCGAPYDIGLNKCPYCGKYNSNTNYTRSRTKLS